MVVCVSLKLLAGLAFFNIASGGLSVNRYSIDKAKDLPSNEEHETKFWHDDAIESLGEKLNLVYRTNKAKNLILFLGDGMSIPTISAARIYKGQLTQNAGENSKLSFEHFPSTGLSKTYCVDKQVADSACSSTAYMGGVKANYATLGVNAAVPLGNCTASLDPKTHVQSILMWAQEAGKGTGLVTTAAITDASPAGGYSHISHRDWQSDKDVVNAGEDPKICPDIAQQLIRSKPGSDVKVILGGGQTKFLPEFYNGDYPIGPGERLDGANLINEWHEDKTLKNKTAKFIYDRTGLLGENLTDAEYILGLFQSDNMLYHLDGKAATQPTLEEMTEIAIKRLKREPNGFYLFVEGALIDKAHHKNWAHRALDETVELSKAVEMALSLTDETDTLIVVTADHAHTMSFSGYPERGNNILGTLINEDKTYPTLGYINGPSASSFKDIDNHEYNHDDMYNDTYLYPSMIKLIDETHGGDDVAVYANGPWSRLFSGNFEQSLIPHMMAFIGGFGPASNIISKTEHTFNKTRLGKNKNNSVLSCEISTNVLILTMAILYFKNILNYEF